MSDTYADRLPELTPIAPAFMASVVRKPVGVFLTNGVALKGAVTAYDDTHLLLTRDGITQLVARHAIATIVPQGGE
jgi:host factor-I protein